MIYMQWVPTGQIVNKEYYDEVLREFRKRFRRRRPALFKSAQLQFQLDNAPVHNSILVTDYLAKMGIKTVPQPPYSPDLSPCDFCLLTRSHKRTSMGAFQKLLERYNKCIAAGGDYFEGDLSFIFVLSIKVPIQKKSGNLFNDPRSIYYIYYIYIYIY